MFLSRSTTADVSALPFGAEIGGRSGTNQRRTDKLPTIPPVNKKKLLYVALAALAFIALSTGGYAVWQYVSAHEETDDAYTTGHLNQVSSRVDGTVTQVLVDDNQLVKAGDPLVKLDPNDYDVKLQEAQAALDTARRQADAARTAISLASVSATAQNTQASGSISNSDAAISRAEAAVVEARAAIPIAEDKVGQTDAELKRAEADYKRYLDLEQQGAVSNQQLDLATRDYAVAKKARASAGEEVRQANARLQQALEGVKSARAQLVQSHAAVQQAQAAAVQTDVNTHQYEVAKASVEQAEAALKNAELQLSYTNIVAPISGRVGKKSVEVGQRVQPGQPLMLVVPDNTWVVANFKETQLEKMHPGQPVEITIDTFPHHKFLGQVDSFSPGSGSSFALLPSDNATGNFTKIVQRVPVKVIFDAASTKGYQSMLVPGLSAVVTVKVN